MQRTLPFDVMQLIKMAVNEDVGTGDITTIPLMQTMGNGTYAFIAKETFILAGTEVVKAVFRHIDPDVAISFKYEEGVQIKSGSRFGTLKGAVASILTGERVALNFLQRLSGIATQTSKAVKTLMTSRTGIDKNRGIRILDTRKTTGGWRSLEKYAVRVGGGVNNRFGLYDAVLIKESHVEAAGGISNAIGLIRPKISVSSKIEVETTNLKEVEAALEAGADIIMLEGMDLESIVKACAMIDGKAKIELAGINMETLHQYARMPVDYISIGALTQNVRCVEISLKMI